MKPLPVFKISQAPNMSMGLVGGVPPTTPPGGRVPVKQPTENMVSLSL